MRFGVVTAVTMKIKANVFLIAMPCLVKYHIFGGTCKAPSSEWQWRNQVPRKFWCLSTKQYLVVNQKALLFTWKWFLASQGSQWIAFCVIVFAKQSWLSKSNCISILIGIRPFRFFLQYSRSNLWTSGKTHWNALFLCECVSFPFQLYYVGCLVREYLIVYVRYGS